MNKRRVAIAAAVITSLVLFFLGERSPLDEFTVKEAPFTIGGADVARCTNDRQEVLPLDIVTVDGEARTRVHLASEATLTVRRNDGVETSRKVLVRSLPYLYLIALLFLLIAIMLPAALGTTWSSLLAEGAGGYSLARVQLIVWFLPAAVLYGALSFCTHGFVALDSQLAILLGLSGATSMLGAAASPPQARGASQPTPELKDLVHDWDAHADVSRYQYLLLSLFGALVLIAGFLQKLEFRPIPSQFLFLIAASQGTYVGTKAIKAAKSADGPRVSLAPGSLTAPPPQGAGKKVPAPDDLSGPGGSFRKLS